MNEGMNYSVTLLVTSTFLAIFRILQSECGFIECNAIQKDKTYLGILLAIVMSGLDGCSLPSMLIPAAWKKTENMVN